MGKSEDHTVKCPFYKDNGPTEIRCEGAEDDMATHMAFATRDLVIQYKDRYCRRHDYCRCLWAEALERKYGNGK